MTSLSKAIPVRTGAQDDMMNDFVVVDRRSQAFSTDVLAAICMGVMYAHGVSVEKNVTKALEQYEEARCAGVPQASTSGNADN